MLSVAVGGARMAEPKQINSLSDLQPDAKNANRGTPRGRGMVEDSLRELGAGRSVLVDRNGRLIAGNKTTEAAFAIGLDDVIVVQSDGTKVVVVQRTDLDLSQDKRARRLAIADNRTSEVGLEWEIPVLLEEPDLLAGMFRDDEIAALLASLDEPQVAGAGGDEFDATPEEGPTRTSYGELWRIGEHRLLVGDSTKADDVARLMGGERAQAVVTDPPYGINREGITNDDPEGLRELFTGCLDVLPIDNGVIVAFQSTRLFPEWLDASRAAGHKFERMLWMYKPNDVTFPWRGWILKSEAILVSSVGKGAWTEVHPFAHDVYTSNWSNETKAALQGVDWHGSIKPMPVMVDVIGRVSSQGGLLYDPFLGSGTTLIAAERTKRRCFGCEIEPKYADVILRRAEAEGISPIERVG
jgi:hypothetical protein